MRYRFLAMLSILWLAAGAQSDSLGRREIEPDMETSFENYELLVVALLGLLLLMGLRFWFRRRRRQG